MTGTRTTKQRYGQLAILTLAGGAVYPLIYLRQNFEVSILESFNITITELGQCYGMLGVIFVATYLPSGWLADRVSPRWLISLSLVLIGLLGLWFATMPGFMSLQMIFAGWGIASGLTFWAALIKAVALLARHDEQGRFFGILDGGRGLVEAILASIAVALFSYGLDALALDTSGSLRNVIYLYVATTFVIAPLVVWLVDDIQDPDHENTSAEKPKFSWADVQLILKKEELWLAGFCILSGYQLFWATYSFSGYLQKEYAMTAVTVGAITVAKLWMRPIGAIAAGFIGDKFNVEKTLAILMLASSIALAMLVFVPVTASAVVLLGIVLAIGLLTYAVRGVYWATLDACGVPARIKGLAIGIISIIGYAPDIYLPLINGPLLEAYPGKTGYAIYFLGIAAFGLLGTAAAWRLKILADRREQAASVSASA